MKHQVRLAQLHLRAEGEACEPQVAELNSCLGERMRTTRRKASCSICMRAIDEDAEEALVDCPDPLLLASVWSSAISVPCMFAAVVGVLQGA